ncbi:MAG: low molecular weight phosphotyrosine protein phosphatase [Opitutales bacterium]|nr:low molecular weight phosphotyrosine protein phosphatase [Opitutales bacterium]MCH8540410.1 low molecular weight phosphotyrosine protein phosphatase [Opitutales bacterium]
MSIRILFVCMGNICRSPAAECVFQKTLEEAGLSGQVEIDSAGTTAFHTGEPPDHRMQQELKKRKVPVFGSARPVGVEDFETFDLVLAMDEDNYRSLQKTSPGKGAKAELKKFGDFCKKTPQADVPDPYYGGRDGFAKVVDMLEDGAQSLLEWVKGKLHSKEVG